VLPQFDLGQYKDLEVEIDDVKIEDADVDKALEELRDPAPQTLSPSRAGPSPMGITRSSS